MISDCGTGWWPGVLPTSITRTSGASSARSSRGPSRSATTTSAWPRSRRPRTVMSPVSPGPPPTRATVPAVAPGRQPVPAQRQVSGFQGGGDGVAQGHGAARVSPGVDGDLDVVHHGDGGSPGGGGFVVGGVDAPDALRLGVGGDLGVHGGVAGGGLDEPDAVDVGRAVRAGLPGEEAGVGEFSQRGAGSGGHDGDAGAGVEQSLGAPRGHRAAADHQHGTAEEAQRRGVNVLNCHASTIGRRHIAEQRCGNTSSRKVTPRHIMAIAAPDCGGRGHPYFTAMSSISLMSGSLASRAGPCSPRAAGMAPLRWACGPPRYRRCRRCRRCSR